ncbi:hypothetical protein GC169_04315 [bacterium]|nr:hypothetical protein [bacterium]
MSVSDAQTLEEIDRIRASGILGEAGRIRLLFDYLASQIGAERSPKEVEIARAVFSRSGDTPGQDDAVVRVYMHRLRKRLEDHYLRGGATAPVRLDIPRGDYRLIGRPADDAADAPVAEGATPPVRRSRRRWAIAVAAAAVLTLANVALWFAVPRTGLYGVASMRASPAWAEFVKSDRPVTVVVGDYYIFGEYEDRLFLKRLVRDFSINSKQDLTERVLTNPEAFDRYSDVALQYLPSSVGQALADVAPLLADRGEVDVRLASELSPETIKTNDILYIGLLSGLGSLKDVVFAGSEFSIGESYDEITDRPSGRRYISEAFVAAPSDAMYRDYGFFSTFAGPAGGRIAVLAGARDTGLLGISEALTKAGASVPEGVSGDFELLYEVKGRKHVNLEAKLVAAYPVDSASHWSFNRTRQIQFPAE